MTEVKTLTPDEYARKVTHGYAGTVSSLLPATVEAWRRVSTVWDGEHWALWNDGAKGTTLGPVNIREALSERVFGDGDRVKIETGGFGKIDRAIRGADGWTYLVSVPGVPSRSTIYVHESRLKLWAPQDEDLYEHAFTGERLTLAELDPSGAGYVPTHWHRVKA